MRKTKKSASPALAEDVASNNQMRRTQEQRRSDAEARLLHAAREIVARKGWVGMTLSEVGAAAGYSRGLATHHFGSKPALLRALAVYIGQNFTGAFNSFPVPRAGMQALLEFIPAYLGRSHEEAVNARALLILMAEGMTDDSETGVDLAAYNQSAIDFLTERFREGIERQDIRSDIDPTAAAIALLGTLRGIMLQKQLKNSTIDVASVIREVVVMTIRGYALRPQAWLARYALPDKLPLA